MAKEKKTVLDEVTPETVETQETQEIQETQEVQDNPTPSDTELWKDAALRAQADLINFRNRTEREREKLWGDARADTAAQLLPVLDNLERALNAPCSDQPYKQGVELTLRQFVEIMQKLGVTEIEAEGKPFDPQLMDAVAHEEDESAAENTVAQVFSKGYRMGDRVLRHAMVKVVN